MKRAIVLFAHGSREPQWARPFERLASAVEQRTDARVIVAYLERMRPSLDEAIAELARDGVRSIRVVPVFLGPGGHASRDLPRLVREASARRAGVAIALDPPIGDQERVIEAIAAVIAAPK